MSLKTILVPFIILNFLLFPRANSEEEVVKQGLIKFMEKLAPNRNNVHRDIPNWGWNLTSDPCTDKWHGVTCHSDNKTVMRIVLENFNLGGVFDITSLSMAKSLMILSLQNNSLHDLVSEEIGNCKSLTHLFLSGNHFSGDFPLSISQLSNLKRLHISDNRFSGGLPNMSHVSGLISFFAENNNFSGVIPDFDFSNLEAFNVSNNNLIGPVPDDVRGKFNADSFYGNPGLCGEPLPNSCPSPSPTHSPSPPPTHSPSPHDQKKGENSMHDALAIYSGWIILFTMVFLFFVIKLVYKFKTNKEALLDADEKDEKAEEITSGEKPSENSYNNTSGSKSGVKSEYSLSSLESGVSSSGLVLTDSKFEALKFEELLSAPAELVWRGKHGSLYKVMLENGVVLAVKRIKDFKISKQDFETRMEVIAQVKHQNVLPIVAYYCSQQEKLLVYEYMQNGNLFMLLYGSQHGQSFVWGLRLNVAAKIAEALAHMHEELHESGIAHGNLKSSNILFDNNMDPFISEYGLIPAEYRYKYAVPHTRSLENRNQTPVTAFKADTYAFGVILLELLTGKVVKNDGFDLAKWVNSVVREEWTVEVFDKSLITQGASEERLMSLLQVALNCINPSPSERPSMNQVAMIIKALKNDDENSVTLEV